MKTVRHSWIVGLLIISSLSLGGCSVEKARALQGAATQFRNESLLAVNAIDAMRLKELEPPDRSASDVRQGFINRILNSRVDLNSAVLDLAIDPYQPPKVAKWDEFIVDLRGQYEGFSSIFDKLDSGRPIDVGEVKKSAEYARVLTVQMALLADAIAKNPPRLNQYRAVTIIRLKKLRQEYQTVQAKLKNGTGNETLQQLTQRKSELENQTGEAMSEWLQIKQEEKKLLEATVAQCMKAVIMGKELLEVANHYDDLDLNQLNAAIPRILTAAAAFTGRDYSAIAAKTSQIATDIRSDPLWRDVSQRLVDRVNSASASRLDLPSRPQ
jgi:hypothetical protein